ncbi:hypothetical protein [Nonomuraea sp. LPB2021202275-12-8]|uniref:hypothetical protein n=1 Tax=Nonomuraea sp. LPB2021202275-12-8 TaxID=3120159 RepID=UPI00300CE9EB
MPVTPYGRVTVLTRRHDDGTTDRSRTPRVEPDGTFSVVALFTRPGQATSIHDHTTWCVVAVIDGVSLHIYGTDLPVVGRPQHSYPDRQGVPQWVN